MGGLAMFLYGMHKMSDGLKAVAGERMKILLRRLTSNRFAAALSGAIVTAVIQSSSVTTVLVVGFVSAGLMTLQQSVGVIMGANVGTTLTAQVVAFHVTDYAWLAVAVGFAAWSMASREVIRNSGAMLMGLGMLFLGMGQMGDATYPLREYPPFIHLMQSLDNRFVALLVGALFTAVIQSSSATTGIVIMLASQGFLSLEAGICLAIGAKIGTCVTALLAAVGRPAEAVRVAVVHVLFNLFGAAVWLPFIPQLAALAEAISPHYPHLAAAEQLAAETPRQIANAITSFAVLNLVGLIWFAKPIASLARRIVPERVMGPLPEFSAKYLDAAVLETPALALDRIRLEVDRLGHYVVELLRQVSRAVVQGTIRQLNEIERRDDDIDRVHRELLDYITRLGRGELTTAQTKQLEELLEVANLIEEMGDLISSNLTTQGRQRIERRLVMGETSRRRIEQFADRVAQAVVDSLRSVADQDLEIARRVIASKAEVHQMADDLNDYFAHRLLDNDPHPVELFRAETDMVGQFKRVFFYARRIAKAVVGHEGFDRIEAQLPAQDQ